MDGHGAGLKKGYNFNFQILFSKTMITCYGKKKGKMKAKITQIEHERIECSKKYKIQVKLQVKY
jgi:hypothetical protein